MGANKWTPGPWFVSGVRFRMNKTDWQSVNRYNEALKRDEDIALIGYDTRTGEGFADAHLIAAAPELYAALSDALNVIREIAKVIKPLINEPALVSGEAALAKARGQS